MAEQELKEKAVSDCIEQLVDELRKTILTFVPDVHNAEGEVVEQELTLDERHVAECLSAGAVLWAIPLTVMRFRSARGSDDLGMMKAHLIHVWKTVLEGIDRNLGEDVSMKKVMWGELHSALTKALQAVADISLL